MHLKKCGDSDLKLSILGAGCWAFGGGEYWGEANQQDVNEVVHAAVELGINYFDTAEVYNDGRSEESLGIALKGIPRNKVLIGTKVAPSNAYKETLIEHCHDSLKRLGMDYIDLYMIHWPIHPHAIRHFTEDESVINNPPALSEAVEALLLLQEQGKIRHIGVSNFGIRWMKALEGLGVRIVVNQLPYNLLCRALEYEILPYCRENKIGVVGYMTLLQGLLADIYPTLKDVPEWRRRTRHYNYKSTELCRHSEEGAEDKTNQALNDIRTIAKKRSMTMTQIAVKWALAAEGICCSLVGTRNIRKLEDNVKAASQPLDKDTVLELNKVTNALKEKLGNVLDYYESSKLDRTR